MRKNVKIVLIAGIIIVVGGFLILLYNGQVKKTFPEDMISDYRCEADSDCVLKPSPFCCGEHVNHIESCFHINENPPKIDCKGIGSCPGFLAIKKGCFCVNNLCTGIPVE